MARLYKQSKSPYWFADYLLADGSRRRVSTKKRHRADAEVVLAELADKENQTGARTRERLGEQEITLDIVDRASGAKLPFRITRAKLAALIGAHQSTGVRSEQGSSSFLKLLEPGNAPIRHERVAEPVDTDKIVERRPLTLRGLAKAADVSLSTASLALRNSNHVAEETRLRVQKLAAKLGYKPNPMVSALMASRVRSRRASDQQIIAYTNSFVRKEEWREFSSLVEYYDGAQERALECGYQLEEFWLREPRMSSRKMSDILFNRGIHGVLLGPLQRKMGHLSMKWDRFSVVALGYSMTQPAVHRAVPDQLAGMRLALRQLRKLGYRRIAVVLDPWQDIRSNKAWTAGFGEYLLFLQPRERTRPFIYVRYDPVRFQRWLRAENPDAVISSNPMIISWMREVGLETPRDYGFVSLNRPLENDVHSGIYQNARAVGAAAIDMIIGQIHRNERGLPAIPKRTIINPEWVDGETTRAMGAGAG
jgi:LacI family transcriptional regulator